MTKKIRFIGAFTDDRKVIIIHILGVFHLLCYILYRHFGQGDFHLEKFFLMA